MRQQCRKENHLRLKLPDFFRLKLHPLRGTFGVFHEIRFFLSLKKMRPVRLHKIKPRQAPGQ